MSDRGWKQFERRLAKDMGVARIPVTGERHGADVRDVMFCYQAKLRKVIPAFLFEWLSGIVATSQGSGRIGVLVLKTPRMSDAESLVIVRWSDWVDLHGPVKFEQQPHRLAEREQGRSRRATQKKVSHEEVRQEVERSIAQHAEAREKQTSASAAPREHAQGERQRV